MFNLDAVMFLFHIAALLLTIDLIYFTVTHTVGSVSKTLIWCRRESRVMTPVVIGYFLIGGYLTIAHLNGGVTLGTLTSANTLTVLVLWLSVVKAVWYKSVLVIHAGDIIRSQHPNLSECQRVAIRNLMGVRVKPRWDRGLPTLQIVAFTSIDPGTGLQMSHYIDDLDVYLRDPLRRV